jgi:MFS family permease
MIHASGEEVRPGAFALQEGGVAPRSGHAYTGQKEDNMTTRAPAAIWTRNFTSLCFANLLFFMSTHMITPTLPLYLQQIGGGSRDVGYVMGAYTIGALVTRPIAGKLLDSMGRKKIVLAALLAAAVISVFYRYATHEGMMLVIRGLHGVAFGVVGTALGTIAADLLPTERFSEGMGYFGVMASLSMAITPMVGFWLVTAAGFPVLFNAVVLATLLAFGLSLAVQSTDHLIAKRDPPLKPAWSGFLEKRALPAAGIMFFVNVIYGAVLSYVALFAAEQGVANIGPFFTAIALTMLVTRVYSGRLADRGGTNKILIVAHIAMLMGITALGLSTKAMHFTVAGGFLGLGLGFCIPTLQAMAVRGVPAKRRGAATGTFFIALDLGIGLGTILWGFVAELIGYRGMFFATLVSLAFAAVLTYASRGTRSHDFSIDHTRLAADPGAGEPAPRRLEQG